MLQDWDKRFPGRIEIMFKALQDVVPSHLLDNQLFDFKQLDRQTRLPEGGDIAFDKPEIITPSINDDDDEITQNQRLDIIQIQ